MLLEYSLMTRPRTILLVSHASYLHISSAYERCGHRFSPLGRLSAVVGGHLIVESLDTGGGFRGSGATGGEGSHLKDGRPVGRDCWNEELLVNIRPCVSY